VNDDRLDELREELARLEEEEVRVSALRRHLHRQIDYGSATDETRARERIVSDERRELHRRIDELRVRLGLERHRTVSLLGGGPDVQPEDVPMWFERRLVDDAGNDLEGHLLG
jgi:hypothetical protein